LNGQLGALDLGVQRMHELLGEYGDATVQAALTALGDSSESLMRAELRALPNDNDGIDDSPLLIRVALEIADDAMLIDFTGTAPQCAGPVNIALPTTVATAYVAIKHLFADLPANAGVMRPIDVRVPVGSILAAQASADLVVANAYGTINALSIAGKRANGQPWVMFSFYGGGHGACCASDGLNHGNAPISTATIPPMEILEAAYPILFRQWALRPDSGGAGEYCGGLGAVYEIEVLAEQGAEAYLFGERGKYAPKGIAGGGEAALNVFSYEQHEGWLQPPMVSKMRGIQLPQGQAVKLQTPGGGGFGNAARREPQRVAADVQHGLVSAEFADEHFGSAWRELDA